jgi:hypothetical protein
MRLVSLPWDQLYTNDLMLAFRLADGSHGAHDRITKFEISAINKINDLHKLARPQVSFYLWFLRVESFFDGLYPDDQAKSRRLTIEVVETDITRLLVTDSGKPRYRLYSPEEGIADGSDDFLPLFDNWLRGRIPENEPRRSEALEIFRKYQGIKQEAWD